MTPTNMPYCRNLFVSDENENQDYVEEEKADNYHRLLYQADHYINNFSTCNTLVLHLVFDPSTIWLYCLISAILILYIIHKLFFSVSITRKLKKISESDVYLLLSKKEAYILIIPLYFNYTLARKSKYWCKMWIKKRTQKHFLWVSI